LEEEASGYSEFVLALAEFCERRGKYNCAVRLYKQLGQAYAAGENSNSDPSDYAFVEDIARIRKKQNNFDPTKVAEEIAESVGIDRSDPSWEKEVAKIKGAILAAAAPKQK
jgi:hypothetical protein